MKTFIKLICVACMILSFQSCTLELQEEISFKEGAIQGDPFANLTAWEYIQTRRTAAIADDQNRVRLDNNELDFMRAAIALMASIQGEEELNKLRAVLRYHIVDEFVAQRPTLTIFDENFIFNTLLPQVDVDPVTEEIIGLSDTPALIAFNRGLQALTRVDTFNINSESAPLPESSTSQSLNTTNQFRHNFVFNNGIGHVINSTVRFQDYEFYSNLSID